MGPRVVERGASRRGRQEAGAAVLLGGTRLGNLGGGNLLSSELRLEGETGRAEHRPGVHRAGVAGLIHRTGNRESPGVSVGVSQLGGDQGAQQRGDWQGAACWEVVRVAPDACCGCDAAAVGASRLHQD